MDNIEELIPAFSTWQTINETFTNLKYTDNNVKRFVNLTKSDEFLKTLICSHNSNLTYEQSEEINVKYKSFTVWVLGRFFYLLGRSKLKGYHLLYRVYYLFITNYFAGFTI